MRLEPGEVPGLPLAAALVDRDGGLVAATPEWTGRCPGALAFRTGQGHVLVAPDAPAPELDVLMDALLAAVAAAAAALDGEAAMQARVLAAGLDLVAGRPAGGPAGTAEDVLALTAAALRSRAPDLAVRVVAPARPAAVDGPAAAALALVQLAVNAWEHEGARRVDLRVGPGPTFAVEWPAPAAAAPRVRSHRHQLRRPRWGWGYVQMVADALGGTALPPGPVRDGTDGACVALGAARLALPLACLRDGRVERATLTWDDDPAPDSLLAELVAAAAREPGRIAYRDLYRARTRGDRTWTALAPESGSSRARDLLRGLHHERALWRAPEPHATRVSAMATLLQVAMGDPWPTVPPRLHAEGLAAACAALGVPMPAPVDGLCPPEPRVTALLLAELGGELRTDGDAVYLAIPPAACERAIARALSVGPAGWLRINP